MRDPDDILIDDLRTAAAAMDPVPRAVVAAARATYTWRTIDQELALIAELAYDSADEDEALAGVRGARGAGTNRLLHFEVEDVVIDVELEGTDAGPVRRLVGHVSPPPAVVELRRPDGSTDVPVDDFGRFALSGETSGPLSFRLVVQGRVVTTDWITA